MIELQNAREPWRMQQGEREEIAHQGGDELSNYYTKISSSHMCFNNQGGIQKKRNIDSLKDQYCLDTVM